MGRLLSRQAYEELLSRTPPEQCLLCDIEKQILLGTSTHWYWIACLSPYWRYHTLFIPKTHLETLYDVSSELFDDFKMLHEKAKRRVQSLALTHSDGKPMDQFITMVRLREDGFEQGSTYKKPRHLHIHFAPDREGVERFVLDPTAVDVTVESLRLP